MSYVNLTLSRPNTLHTVNAARNHTSQRRFRGDNAGDPLGVFHEVERRLYVCRHARTQRRCHVGADVQAGVGESRLTESVVHSLIDLARREVGVT